MASADEVTSAAIRGNECLDREDWKCATKNYIFYLENGNLTNEQERAAAPAILTAGSNYSLRGLMDGDPDDEYFRLIRPVIVLAQTIYPHGSMYEAFIQPRLQMRYADAGSCEASDRTIERMRQMLAKIDLWEDDRDDRDTQTAQADLESHLFDPAECNATAYKTLRGCKPIAQDDFIPFPCKYE